MKNTDTIMTAAECFGTCLGKAAWLTVAMSKTLGFAYIFTKTKGKFGTVAALAGLAGLEIIWQKSGKALVTSVRKNTHGSRNHD